MKPADFISTRGVVPPQSRRCSFIVTPVLHFLWGLPWDELTLNWVCSLQPGMIRVTAGETTADAVPSRVTVCVDEDNNITAISQELSASLDAGNFENGHDLKWQTVRAVHRAGQDPYGTLLPATWRPKTVAGRAAVLIDQRDPACEFLHHCLSVAKANVCRLETVKKPGDTILIYLRECRCCGGEHVLGFTPLPARTSLHSHRATCPARGEEVRVQLGPDYCRGE